MLATLPLATPPFNASFYLNLYASSSLCDACFYVSRVHFVGEVRKAAQLVWWVEFISRVASSIRYY